MAVDYDIKLDRLREDKTNELNRDNMKSIRQALDQLQEIISDIDARLKAAGF